MFIRRPHFTLDELPTTSTPGRAISRGLRDEQGRIRALRRFPIRRARNAASISRTDAVFDVSTLHNLRRFPKMNRGVVSRRIGRRFGGAVVNRFASFLALVVLGVTVWPEPSSAAKPLPSAIELDDRPEPFVPAKPATEEDKYRQQSLSHYAAGLMYEQQGNREEALRQYQRALRFDPQAGAVLQQIVEVAWALERHLEAIRYALKAAEVAPSNPELLERLAAFLVQENDIKRAVELYEKAIELQQGKEKTAGYVRLKMLVGRLYARLDDFPKAAEAFAIVVAALDDADAHGLRGKLKTTLEGEKGSGYLIFGETFLRADRLDAAEAAFEKAFQGSGDEALHAFNQAQVLEKRKQPAEALAKLEVYFEAESDVAASSPYELLKRLLAESMRDDELVPKLEKLLKADPKNVALRYALAGEYRSAKNYAKAKPLFDDLLRRAATIDAYEGVLESSLNLKDYARIAEVLAEVTAKTGDLDAVKKFVEELVADPQQLDALADAARKLDKAGSPEDGKPVAFAVAQVFLKAKKYDAAGEFYELALLHDPKTGAPIFLSWGMGLLGDEQNDAAIKVFTRAVDDNASAEEPIFQTYLALALEFAGRTDEALAMIRKAVELGGGELRYAVRVPWVLYHGKRYSEAAAAYEALLAKYDAERKSDQDRKLLREARLSYSNVCVLMGQLDKAEKPLEEVLDEFPDDLGAMNDLGYLWADRGKNLELALEMVRKAVAAEPDNRAYRDSLGWVYYRLNRFSESVAELEKATARNPEDKDDEPDAVILDHLGDAYAGAGRADEARKAWQRAAKAYEKSGQEKDKLAAVRKKLAK
jgi:tetratricopeptide (TPR) repeat protein